MNLGHNNYFLQDPIWYNKNVRLKTKRYFYYPDWHNRGISTLGDLYRGHDFVKTFGDLVLEYDISIKDRRKYNSLMNGILLDWFDYPFQVQIPFLMKLLKHFLVMSKLLSHLRIYLNLRIFL